MRLLLPIGFFLLASCNSQSGETTVSFKRDIPDTIKGWAGQMTKASYHKTKRLAAKLGLLDLSGGVRNTEIRVWGLSGFYEPQVLFILNNDSTGEWHLRTVTPYSTGDSIYADYSRTIRQGAVDSFHLDRYWTLASQSELKEGDSYGCVDGGDVFIEMSSSSKYRFMWYRCPDMNKDKDSVFLLADRLASSLDAMAVNHP